MMVCYIYFRIILFLKVLVIFPEWIRYRLVLSIYDWSRIVRLCYIHSSSCPTSLMSKKLSTKIILFGKTLLSNFGSSDSYHYRPTWTFLYSNNWFSKDHLRLVSWDQQHLFFGLVGGFINGPSRKLLHKWHHGGRLSSRKAVTIIIKMINEEILCLLNNSSWRRIGWRCC